MDFGPNQTNSVACIQNVSDSYSVLKTQRVAWLSVSTKKLKKPWSDILRFCDLIWKNQINKKKHRNCEYAHFMFLQLNS